MRRYGICREGGNLSGDHGDATRTHRRTAHAGAHACIRTHMHTSIPLQRSSTEMSPSSHPATRPATSLAPRLGPSDPLVRALPAASVCSGQISQPRVKSLFKLVSPRQTRHVCSINHWPNRQWSNLHWLNLHQSHRLVQGWFRVGSTDHSPDCWTAGHTV